MTTKVGEHIVTLSSDTLQRINAIALYRQEQKRGRGQTNQKISKEGALQIEISGLKGEFAVAQYYDIERFLAEALHHAPHKMGQKITTWMGVGMTQPESVLRECEKCSYHYAPINRMKTRV